MNEKLEFKLESAISKKVKGGSGEDLGVVVRKKYVSEEIESPLKVNEIYDLDGKLILKEVESKTNILNIQLEKAYKLGLKEAYLVGDKN